VDWLSIDKIMYCAVAEGKCKVKMFDSDIQKLIQQFTFNIHMYIHIYTHIYAYICIYMHI